VDTVTPTLQECHSHGHTFGDVKLANFLLRHPYTQPGEGAQLAVIACDFGCAQHVKSRSHASAASMRRMGSPVYMAPELWQATGTSRGRGGLLPVSASVGR
jgi:serine/threonine protein kinase